MHIQGAAAAPPASSTEPAGPTDPLWNSASALECVFVSEFLKCAGLDAALGGAGSSGGAFASFAVDFYAEQFVGKGGFGLAEAIYAQLKGGGQ